MDTKKVKCSNFLSGANNATGASQTFDAAKVQKRIDITKLGYQKSADFDILHIKKIADFDILRTKKFADFDKIAKLICIIQRFSVPLQRFLAQGN